MNQIEIKQLEKELEALEGFLDEDVHFEDEIIHWVSSCAEFFLRVGLNDIVISAFINFYLLKKEKRNTGILSYQVKKMGNFEVGELSYAYEKIEESYMAKVAFTIARGILKQKEEEERLVPIWIIRQLSNENIYQNIVSSLELIEENYQDKNADGLLKNSITLLENILDLDTELSGEKLNKKIKELIKNDEKKELFGIGKEIVFALDNSRLVRNIKGVHKTRPMKYDIPFLIAVSNAYLVILMLEMALSCGEVFEKLNNEK